MWKTHSFAVAACAAAVVGVGASAGFAGEITGNGKPTPIGNGTANNSLCAFSGQNDLNPDQGQIDRRVQTPKDGPPGAAAHGWAPDPSDPTFILTCNKNGPVG